MCGAITPPYGGLSLLTGLPQTRKTFFSFHHQEDIMRVNQVRKSNKYGTRAGRGRLEFYDGSLWEPSRRENEESLKALIRDGMKNTSVTCVLTGRYTYQREWVRYELARSVVKGNGLLNVYIDQCRDPRNRVSIRGPNPLDYMGVYKGHNGILLAEKNDRNRWIQYEKYKSYVTLPGQWAAPTSDSVVPLSHYAPKSYCFVHNNGHTNLADWIHDAALAVANHGFGALLGSNSYPFR